MSKSRHALWRLATVDGVPVSSGYKSGRNRWREIPDRHSTSSTRSAGKRDVIQPETVPCDFRPSARARALCPPTALQASNNASLLMTPINAETGNGFNANSGNCARQTSRMGKRTELPASEFWQRLTEALGEKWRPLNSNSLATRLKMSQGSVHRWFTGQGLPELSTALDLAKEGGVCVDWLLNGFKPKYPISRDPLLRELFEICEDLGRDARERVLRVARGELLQQQRDQHEESQPRTGGSVRNN